MRVEDCYQLGYISKTHGLQGEVQIFLDVDSPENYKTLESVFINNDNTLIPFIIDHIQIGSSRVIVKFEEVDNIDQASELVSMELYLPLSALPKLPNGKYYYHEIIGFEFLNNGEFIGKVTGIYNLTAQNLIAVDHKGTEVLVPMTDEIITEVDTNTCKVHSHLPDGLLELYTQDNED